MTVEEIYEEHKGLIHIQTKTYARFVPKEEILGIQLRAIFYTIQKFDKTKAKFSTYLHQNIRFFFLKYLKRRKKDKELFRSFIQKEDEEIPSNRNNLNVEFIELIECLPTIQKEILTEKYIYNYTYREIGIKHSLSPTRIHDIVKDSIVFIKNKNFD